MKRPIYVAFLLFSMVFTNIETKAQLADGATAPDFTVKALNGVTYNLYSILDSGYYVFLDFGGTW